MMHTSYGARYAESLIIHSSGRRRASRTALSTSPEALTTRTPLEASTLDGISPISLTTTVPHPARDDAIPSMWSR